MTSRIQRINVDRPPDFIEVRYCPVDEGHWRTDGDFCPVCGEDIVTLMYRPMKPNMIPVDTSKQRIHLQEYDVWLEGYVATGEHGTATFCGTILAESFEEACRKWAYRADFKQAEALGIPTPSNYDPERNTYWGCRFFEREADARRSFG